MPAYTIHTLLRLPYYTEGPAVDAAGNYYCTTLTGGSIECRQPDGTQRTFARAACPNGQLIRPNGDHLVCDTGRAAVSRFHSDGTFAGDVVKGLCAGVAFDTPNDLIADAAGNIYFTDSIRHHGKVFFVAKEGGQQLVAGGIDYANGLVLSRDERYLFVAESYANRILRIPLSGPGVAAGPAEVFATLPFHTQGYHLPDGLAMDSKGRLWVAHYGMQAVQVLGTDGRLACSIDTGMPLVSNLCWVRDTGDAQTLLVTGGTGEPGPGALLLIDVTGA